LFPALFMAEPRFFSMMSNLLEIINKKFGIAFSVCGKVGCKNV